MSKTGSPNNLWSIICFNAIRTYQYKIKKCCNYLWQIFWLLSTKITLSVSSTVMIGRPKERASRTFVVRRNCFTFFLSDGWISIFHKTEWKNLLTMEKSWPKTITFIFVFLKVQLLSSHHYHQYFQVATAVVVELDELKYFVQ